MSLLKSRDFGMFVILLLLVGGITFANPDAFLGPYNLHNLLRQISFLAIFSIGVTFVIITAGIDLSLGSLIAFCGVISAMTLDAMGRVFQSWTDAGYAPSFIETTNLFVACIAVVVSGTLVGVYHGFIVARFNIPPFVVTLGSMCILRSVAYLLTTAVPIPILNERYNAMGNEGFLSIPSLTSPSHWFPASGPATWWQWVPIPISFWFCIVVAVVCHVLLISTRFGRNVYAVGGNEQTAFLSGVSVFWTKIGAYALCGGLTAVSALLYSAYERQGSPSTGMAYELNAIAAAVIGGCSLMGGSGSVLGTLIGASIFSVIINGINLIVQRNASFWEGTIVGIVVVAAVTFNTIRGRRQQA